MDERIVQFRVGVMVFATLIITAILLVMLGELPKVIYGTYTVYVKFPEAPGVTEGTPVRKSGILIGRVKEVQFAKDDTAVIVTAEIQAKRRLYENEACVVEPSLLGDTIVQFVRRDDTTELGPRLEDGAQLDGIVKRDPIRLIEDLEGRFSKVIDSVTNASDAFTSASADLGTAARNVSDLIEGNQEEMERALKQTNRTLAAVEKAAISANNLIGDEEIQKQLKEALNRLPQMLENAHQTMVLVDRNLRNLEKFTEPLGKNAEDRVDRIDHAIYQLDRMMTQMASFSQSLNQRQGSLGLLVHDRELYDHLKRAAKNIDELVRQLKPIVYDARVFTDKIARHPGIIVRDAVRPSPGIK